LFSARFTALFLNVACAAGLSRGTTSSGHCRRAQARPVQFRLGARLFSAEGAALECFTARVCASLTALAHLSAARHAAGLGHFLTDRSLSSVSAFAPAADKQDLIVVGGGPGGYVAAIKAGQMGMKVTCVEKRGTLGGTCLNVGCIPSKALLHASHLYHQAKHDMGKFGINATGVSLDLSKMLANKDKNVRQLTGGIEGLFKKNKVNYVKGWGKFASANEIEVDCNDGTKKTIWGKNILVATGSEIMSIPGVTIDEKRIVSSTGALALTAVPKKMVVIGAGVIGLEMGSVWSRLGAEVTVIEFGDRIVPSLDAETAKLFQKILEKQGFKFRFAQKVTKADTSGPVIKVSVESVTPGGAAEVIDADVVLVSTGRRPFTDGLNHEVDYSRANFTLSRLHLDIQYIRFLWQGAVQSFSYFRLFCLIFSLPENQPRDGRQEDQDRRPLQDQRAVRVGDRRRRRRPDARAQGRGGGHRRRRVHGRQARPRQL
jgi:NADPH-dependent 2,4-dienoyl-CoA reductase/sulfur reductase-like enzyme